ncbi:hypothetical protein [Acutalibacter sp. 1XD8-36]|uniref:hypothetical protein n=1 Tax=Acutalibacter sp. 1XD8-36 TaxID=2320852 RepID=UPI0014125870|nr:hypothetical protein [Acutalibacter sp. 1XD8-36]NBJ90500.1 hypothetical protein [Acutalibacter sp. 1XD8-36]
MNWAALLPSLKIGIYRFLSAFTITYQYFTKLQADLQGKREDFAFFPYGARLTGKGEGVIIKRLPGVLPCEGAENITNKFYIYNFIYNYIIEYR